MKGLKQRYFFKYCGMKFVEKDDRVKGKYSNKDKALVIRMYITTAALEE